MKFNRLRLIGELLGLDCQDRPITGFAMDSREVENGYLFFALRGEKFDGHDFLHEVGKKGGAAAVVDGTYQGETGGLILLRVEDVVAAMQKLAREAQKRRKQRIIAVTGSVGKTTTKEFIAILLSQKFTVYKTPGNSNSQRGLPLAILRASGEEEVFIVEMAMSEFKQIEKLVQIAPPEIAVITKIGYSHVDTIPSGLEGIATAKAEILMDPSTQWGVIEQEAASYAPIQQAGSCAKVTYGMACVRAERADMVLEPGVLEAGWVLNYQGDQSPVFRLPFSETHFLQNFAGAATVAKLMGLSWEEILKGVGDLKPIKLRFEKIDRNGVLIINDSYNASPESTKAAFENLPSPSFGCKTIVVFGEMLTLGRYSEEGHKKVGELALSKADHLLCYGKRCMPMIEMFASHGKPAEFFRDLNTLKKTLFDLSKPGDVVLIKGSNSHKLWQLLE